MGGAKALANRAAPPPRDGGSSSGDTSSSGKASHSANSGYRSVASRSVASNHTAYDGNRDSGSRGGTPQPVSRSTTPQAGASRTGTPAGGVRDPNTSKTAVSDVKYIALPVAAYSRMRGQDAPGGDPRPPPSRIGQPIKIALNTFDAEITNIKVYQYEVLIGSGVEKRGLVMNVWESKAVKSALGSGFIFDGNRLAWSTKSLAADRELRLVVDLDQERGKQPRANKPNIHRVVIRQTNPVHLPALMNYMQAHCSFDNKCLEAITFLNHTLRETPSTKFTTIKQSFFARGQARFSLTGPVEALKGVYSSMRIVHTGPNNLGRLSINIDVANGTFWTESALVNAAVNLTGKRDANDLAAAIRQQGPNGRTATDLKKMRKLRVIAKHRGGKEDRYVIDKFIYKTAREVTFDKDGKQISIFDYFLKSFNIRLTQPDLPLVQMTKGKNTYVPMELLKIEQNQRYAFKLDERQMSNMIKFAVTPPPERKKDIEHGLKMLDHANDPVLKAFGIRVNPSMKMVEGRLINAPKVQYAVGAATPGTSGRWDLKGKKFLSPNATPLKSWAICVVPSRRGGKPDKAVVENFIREFIKVYINHGGRVENKQPAMALASGDDVGAWVTNTWNAAGNQSQSRPQILMFLLPDKDSQNYGRIKRSCECRYGVVSQCVQYAQAQKAAPQYLSNVCMKFNSKLGGQTARAVGQKSGGPTGHFNVPTAIIGADVSHAAPGSMAPSMAAMTISMDRLGIRYAAAAETNGYRVEMITTENIQGILKPMLQSWIMNVGGGKFPSRIIYFRDGVSEGQFSHVLQQEVKDMKDLIKSANASQDIPFIVITGSKRHHVRFFPERGDKNGNALPGTLVETGVTQPFENDFYLCSHNALKGTARPMHYHVLLNEAKMSNEELQTLIYEQCYQFVRSTTPISQHPAIYYAHIASNRAIPHDPKWSGSSDGTPSTGAAARSGSGSHARSGDDSSGPPQEFDKLMPMPNQGGIMTSMWYV